MRLINLLQQKSFENSKVLTDDIGLENVIESVMIIEALDIEKWAVRNQILLTSYIAFQDKSLNEIKLFFEKISRIGISGIIIKTKRFIPEVPPFFIELCFSYNIPLIEIPSSVSYESIILSIHEPLLNYESFLLRSYYDASKTFSNLVNPRNSYEDLVNSFIRFTKLPISLSIPENSFSYQSENFPPIRKKHYIEFEILNHYAQHHYYLRTYPNSDTTVPKELYYLDIKNIIDDKRYNFQINLPSDRIDHSLILSVEKFLEVLSQKLDSDYYRKNEIFLHRNKTISAVLFGINRNVYDLEVLLQDINLFDYKYYQVLLLSLPNTIKKIDLKRIKDSMTKSKVSHVYYESKDTLVYIFNYQEDNMRIQKNYLKKLLPELEDVNHYLSKAGDYREIQKLFSTCLKMKQFNDTFYISSFISQEDLGIFNFLINIPSENYSNMIPNSLLKIYEEKYELFETLYVFITNNLNYGATATELFLHPKTIRYRISKIENLLQLDLNNPIQLTNYTIGCILLNLRHQNKNAKN